MPQLSPGMPLPQTTADFLPDVSWATEPGWELFHEELLAQEGQGQGQGLPTTDEPVSPPACWPTSAPPLLDTAAETLAFSALDTILIEDEAGRAPAAASGPSHTLPAQKRDSAASLQRPEDPFLDGPGAQECFSKSGQATRGGETQASCDGLPRGRDIGGKGVYQRRPAAKAPKPADSRVRKRLRPKQQQHPVAQRQVKFPVDLPRMSPQCLRNAHKSEQEPAQLLQEAMQGVSPALFGRGNSQAEDYSNLEEFSLCKSAQVGGPPFVVATASLEGADMIKSVWSAQRSSHLGKVMIRPPHGPSAPTSCLIDNCQDGANTSPDGLVMAAEFANKGVAASPKHCQGLPSQCMSWVDAPEVPQTPLKSDFALMSSNIGRMRRSGYLHVLTSSQLSCIASMPGSIAVRFLLLMSTLLGQPLVGSALHMGNASAINPTLQGQPMTAIKDISVLPLAQPLTSENPQPLWGWNPNTKFQKHTAHLGDTGVTLLLGHLPALQITLPTAQRRMLRLDRIVDLKEISALQHNAVRWTNQAMDSAEPLTRNGFRILKGYESEAASVEYYLHRHPLSAPECQAMALAKHGRLPISQAEVAYATATIVWPQMLWVQTTQSSAKDGDDFRYQLNLGHRQLLPPLPDRPHCQIFHLVGGDTRQISTDGIGAHYLWYQHTGSHGQYHVYSPWSLAVAMAPNGSCSIFVPTAAHTKAPPPYLQKCLILRNGSLAATNQRQLQSAVALQQSRLLAIEGLPCEARLNNQERTLGPLQIDAARVVQPLQSGGERLLLETSQQALQPGIREGTLQPQDFRPLQTGVQGDLQPIPTPAPLLTLGTTLLATAGNFLVSGVTQDIVSEAMAKIAAAGKYRYIDPLLLSRAITSPDRQSYLRSVNTEKHNGSYTWDEQKGILLLKGLQSLGHIPPTAASDESQLASGLAIVTSAADTLEEFNVAGLQEMEAVALNFLASSNLNIDTQGGALCYVLRSGSVALVSYYLSVIDSAPALLSHRLHGLPAFQGTKQDEVIVIDLPRRFRLTHLPTDVNSTAAQTSCARALTSQEYAAALGPDHPACVTKEMTRAMMYLIYSNGHTRVIQTTSAPDLHITAFLACSGTAAKRFTLHSEVNVFVLPAHCAMDLSLSSKLKSIQRTQSEPGAVVFQWLLSYNTSAYDRPLTKAEEVYIILYSIAGAAILFALLLTGLLFKFRKRLPCFRAQEPATNTYFGFDRATIYHPHLGPRTLSDFSSSAESLTEAAGPPGPRPTAGAVSPFVRPSALRDYTRFAGYTATVRRAPKKRSNVSEVRAPVSPAHLTTGQPSAEAAEETTL